MNCRKAQKWMSQAMDGELDARRKAWLDAHVAGCTACQSAQAVWMQAGEHLRAEPISVPPAEVMWMDVQRAIRLSAPVPEPVLVFQRLKWASVVIGLALLGSGIWGTLRVASMARLAAQAEPAPPVVEWAEAELPGSSTMVYEDGETETVVIWLMTAENGAGAPKGT